jgi:hypothetical protein
MVSFLHAEFSVIRLDDYHQTVATVLMEILISSEPVDSKESWRWCITLRITGFLNFVQCPGF